MELVDSKEDLLNNLAAFDNKLKNELDALGFYHGLVKRGHNFVSYMVGDEWRFAPSRYIGYKDNSEEKHGNNRLNGGATDKRISKLLGEHQPDREKTRLFRKFAKKLNIEPNDNKHKFFTESLYLSSDVDDTDPMEIPKNAPVLEGAKKSILVNGFERDPKLRKQCVQHWGCKCCVCDFDFSATYGEIGRGFIHVHHVVPLASISDAHEVDPIKDLIPVCPNCHAMLHRSRGTDNPRRVDELRNLVMNARKRR